MYVNMHAIIVRCLNPHKTAVDSFTKSLPTIIFQYNSFIRPS